MRSNARDQGNQANDEKDRRVKEDETREQADDEPNSRPNHHGNPGKYLASAIRILVRLTLGLLAMSCCNVLIAHARLALNGWFRSRLDRGDRGYRLHWRGADGHIIPEIIIS